LIDVEIIQGDFLRLDLSKYDIIVAYLSIHGNAALCKKILDETKSGTEIVAVGFRMNGLGTEIAIYQASSGLHAYRYIRT
jgi:hypothetical protein